MSTHIEHADALAVLAELPNGWAQTTITNPPASDTNTTLAVLAEVQRVLREDGTLWLLRRPEEPLLTGLLTQGWLRQRLPVWATPLAGRTSLRPLLLSNSSRYFQRRLHKRPNPTLSRDARRGCCPQAQRELIERCVLACSSMPACGACGSPYRPARRSDQTPATQHASCVHRDPRGRCLVLDPFYKPRVGTAEIAARHGRSFLGITSVEPR